MTTELQRILLDDETNATSVCVFVNGAAFEKVETIDLFLPPFVKLMDKLKAMPKSSKDRIAFYCIEGINAVPFDDLREWLAQLSTVSEAVAHKSGFTNAKTSQTFESEDFSWNDFISAAQAATRLANSQDEQPIGNERLQVFPVHTLLSHLLVKADCVVNVIPVVKRRTTFPEDYERDLNEFIPQHKYEQQRNYN